MTIPYPIKKTIEVRRSARSYQMVGVEKGLMDEIKDYARSLAVPFAHQVEIKFFKANPTKALYTVINRLRIT